MDFYKNWHMEFLTIILNKQGFNIHVFSLNQVSISNSVSQSVESNHWSYFPWYIFEILF